MYLLQMENLTTEEQQHLGMFTRIRPLVRRPGFKPSYSLFSEFQIEKQILLSLSGQEVYCRIVHV